MDSDGEEFADEYLAEESGILVNYYNGGRLAGAPSAVPPVGNNPNGYILIIILGVPTWAPPSPGTLVLLEEQTASGATNVNFTTGFSSSYRSYHFQYYNVTGSVNSTIRLRLSTNGGSSYETTNYTNTSSGASTTFIAPNGTTTFSGTAMYGETIAINPNDTSVRKDGWFRGIQGGTQNFGFWTHTTTSAINAFRWDKSSGTISGTFRLYGML